MSPADQDTDSLSSLEDRIQRAVQLVARLRQEKEAAVAEAVEARRAAALAADEVKNLHAERKQVRSRIEKLLGQIDQLSAS
jgi:FtsZ-binding cell division protein ZapB